MAMVQIEFFAEDASEVYQWAEDNELMHLCPGRHPFADRVTSVHEILPGKVGVTIAGSDTSALLYDNRRTLAAMLSELDLSWPFRATTQIQLKTPFDRSIHGVWADHILYSAPVEGIAVAKLVNGTPHLPVDLFSRIRWDYGIKEMTQRFVKIYTLFEELDSQCRSRDTMLVLQPNTTGEFMRSIQGSL
jgi:hypothetical protein